MKRNRHLGNAGAPSTPNDATEVQQEKEADSIVVTSDGDRINTKLNAAAPPFLPAQPVGHTGVDAIDTHQLPEDVPESGYWEQSTPLPEFTDASDDTSDIAEDPAIVPVELVDPEGEPPDQM